MTSPRLLSVAFFTLIANHIIVPVNEMVRTPDLPTFWEFVQWIVNNDGWKRDHHFYDYSYCAYCSFGFDFIIKHENYFQENLDFVKETGLDEYMSDVSILESKVNVHRPKGLSS